MVTNAPRGAERGEFIQMKNRVTHPELRAMMARTNTTRQELAEAVGIAYRTFSSKLNREIIGDREPATFNIDEAAKIIMHFRQKGIEVTSDELFFDQVVTNVTTRELRGGLKIG